VIDALALSRALDEAKVGEGARALSLLIHAKPAISFEEAQARLRVTARSLLRYENALLRAGLLKIVIDWMGSGRRRRYDLQRWLREAA
jgi:predicted DNA-binding transcriptional regulator